MLVDVSVAAAADAVMPAVRDVKVVVVHAMDNGY